MRQGLLGKLLTSSSYNSLSFHTEWKKLIEQKVSFASVRSRSIMQRTKFLSVYPFVYESLPIELSYRRIGSFRQNSIQSCLEILFGIPISLDTYTSMNMREGAPFCCPRSIGFLVSFYFLIDMLQIQSEESQGTLSQQDSPDPSNPREFIFPYRQRVNFLLKVDDSSSSYS